MTFNEIMNSPLLYALVGAGIVYILIFCVITLRKAYRHGLEIGLTKEKLKTAITSSAIYSIVPSISIVIGLFSLAAVLGVPWSWFRLSVVGSVTYELMAADMVATGAGYESIAALNAAGDASIVGTVMFVMSICILGGIVGVLIFGKRVQTSLQKAKKHTWSDGRSPDRRTVTGYHRSIPSDSDHEGTGLSGGSRYLLRDRHDTYGCY